MTPLTGRETSYAHLSPFLSSIFTQLSPTPQYATRPPLHLLPAVYDHRRPYQPASLGELKGGHLIGGEEWRMAAPVMPEEGGSGWEYHARRTSLTQMYERKKQEMGEAVAVFSNTSILHLYYFRLYSN